MARYGRVSILGFVVGTVFGMRMAYCTFDWHLLLSLSASVGVGWAVALTVDGMIARWYQRGTKD